MVFVRIHTYWTIVSPSPTCCVSGLPQAFVFRFNDMPFQQMTVVVNICQYLMFAAIFENIKLTRNATPYRQMVDFRPELSCRPDW